MLSSCSDEDLLRRMELKESDCLDELVKRYSNKVYSLAMRLVSYREDAEEIHQDVFITVYKKPWAFQGKSAFSSWIYRVTVNFALMKLRSRRRSRTVYMDDISPEHTEMALHMTRPSLDTDSALDKTRLHAALESAIGRLPDDYRPVYVMRDIDGLSSTQVGRMLDLSVPTVKSRLHRSRLMLRRRLLPIYREYCGETMEPTAT